MSNTSGNLKVHCFFESTYIPIEGVSVSIYNADRDLNTEELVKTVVTNAEGYVDNIMLPTPDENSNLAVGELPYGLYNLSLSKSGYKNLVVRGVQVFPNKVSIQRCYLERGEENCRCCTKTISIPEHKQVMQKCSKNQSETMQSLKLRAEKSAMKRGKSNRKNRNLRVLSSVEVPSVITVHDGSPTNNQAPNYTVNFVDYIKNVASSELYSTWDSDCLRANIYCIVSFALNRIYTEWYKAQGYNFDITNDTAYDQSFSYGRTTYDSIDIIVEQLFTNYLQEQGEKAPLLAQFCNGTTSTCPGWLSQWGSEYLAQNGYTPYEILTYYYGNNINILEATKVNGYPVSYPGYSLTLWIQGSSVKTIQSQLNAISNNYPLIPKLDEDGIYGPKTENSVKIFQGIFDLPTTGIVNSATWYSISRVYVGVTNIAAGIQSN